MASTSITPSGTIENVVTIMLSAKELLAQQINLAAQNLSNADTVSFKGLMQSGLEAVYKNPNLMSATGRGTSVSYVQGAPVKRNITQGSLKRTHSPHDIALNGLGYFVIQAGDTEQLTRDGRLHLDLQGRLVTMDGHPIQGSNGDINLGSYASFSILKDGTILAFDQQGLQTEMGKIKIVAVKDEHRDLSYVGQGRFLRIGAEQEPPSDTFMMQGFLEQSNVNPMEESVKLMQVMAHYKESQNVTDMYDSVISKTINLRVGGA